MGDNLNNYEDCKMTDFNCVILGGRVTYISDKDYGVVGNGFQKLTLHVASNKAKKNGEEWTEETSFFDVIVWGKQAENLKSKISKGVPLLIKGELIQNRWKDKDGINKSKIYINAESVRLLSNEKASEKPNGNAFQKIPSNVKAVAEVFEGEAFPEDIPF